MDFLFLKILLILLQSLMVCMETSSDEFPKIQDLKSSLNISQTFIPTNMSDCTFESKDNSIDVICDSPKWIQNIERNQIPGNVRYLKLQNSSLKVLNFSDFQNRTVYLFEIIDNIMLSEIQQNHLNPLSDSLLALSISNTGMIARSNSIFNSFQQFNNLKYLILEDNPFLNLEGVGVEENDEKILYNLEYLSFKGSDLQTIESQLFKPLSNSTRLTHLNLQSCNLSSIALETFKYLPYLEHIGKLQILS